MGIYQTFLGNLREFYQGQVGEAEFKWREEFGGVVRIKGSLGGDELLITDPKALQYICQVSGYSFRKQPNDRALSGIVGGRGISWTEGDDHKRHRKMMLPAFTTPEIKSLLPIFHECIKQITTRWNDILSDIPDQLVVFDIPSWMSRATFDIIGEAGFDHRFGAMNNTGNPVTESYKRLFTDMFGTPSTSAIFIQSLLQHIPISVLDILLDYAPIPQLVCTKVNKKFAIDMAKALVNSKTSTPLTRKSSRDLLSVLVEATASETPGQHLTNEELYENIRTMILAGHETTANTVTWSLLELAKQPEIQTRLRTEIRATEAAVQTRGDTDITIRDFDAMSYTTAVIKETLRFHPVVYNNFREASKDEILPLSKPITTNTGEVVTEILVPKGTKVILSIAAYNRDKDIWGEDSHTFRPERWLDHTLDNKRGPSLGVYGNLLTFSGGVRSCIGWRFAVMEIQAVLVELIGSFEFSPTTEALEIRREACGVMVPTIEGEVKKGAQLPLKVSIASRDQGS